MGGGQRLARRLYLLVSRPLHAREPELENAGAAVATAGAIVVLGAPLDDHDRLTDIGLERAQAAAALWHRGGAARVIPSGGLTRGAVRSEAAAMADELMAQGVPREAILLEELARTTAENARYCAELLREDQGAGAIGGPLGGPRHRATAPAAGSSREPSPGPTSGASLGASLEPSPGPTSSASLGASLEPSPGPTSGASLGSSLEPSPVPTSGASLEPSPSPSPSPSPTSGATSGPSRRSPLGSVWLVTQPFHGRRSRLCFRRAGFDARVWPIVDSLEHRDPRRALRWCLREYLAWIKALLVR
jgi:uncharacterized SAM-binding protein YcdF (DUF218 family)